MPKRPAALPFSAFALDASHRAPLYRQLYDGLRAAILSGQLVSGTRLPPTRDLAAQLSVSRNTVMNAYDQLLAEGYVEAHTGSGTFVSSSLPDDLLSARGQARRAPQLQPPTGVRLSRRGMALAATLITTSQFSDETRAFRPCTPALDAFPVNLWTRLSTKYTRRLPRTLLGYGHPAGYRPLREAIAAYLGMARAVRCDPDQIIVVAGAQQALDIAARVLLDPGDPVWVEDPGYLGARGALQGAGARLIPVPVDGEGLDVEAGAASGPAARLIYVSPSNQYPLGVTMSLGRRLALLEWAKRSDAWVLEDDYDSEYRYTGRPLSSLQGLDEEGRVIYLGTFSKILFPALRLGYMVVPARLAKAFAAARALIDRYSPTIEQAVVAEFITEGHLARHLRKTRALNIERQEMLVHAIRRQLGDFLDISPLPAGLHLTAWLREGMNDQEVSREAAAQGVDVQPLSAYYFDRPRHSGLVLGYAAYNEREIRTGINRLAAACRIVSRSCIRRAS